jgi:hypothetical protein
MAFAPRAVLKDFQNLSLFQHEIAEQTALGATILTLRRGREKGDVRKISRPWLESAPSLGIVHSEI